MNVTSYKKDRKAIQAKCNCFLRKHEITRYKLLEQWDGRLVEYIAPQTYRRLGPWKKICSGTKWQEEGTLQLKKEISIPAGFSPDHTYLEAMFEGAEALVSLNGRICGAIDRRHHFVQIPSKIFKKRSVLIEMEVWLNANRITPGGFSGDAVFQQARLIERNNDVWRYLLHMNLAAALMEELQIENKGVADDLQSAAHKSIYKVDFQSEGKPFQDSVRKAEQCLEHQLSLINSPMGGNLFLAGHTHIDTGWLWPYKETVRKCSRTFVTMLTHIQKYPDFTFSCSQPQLFEYTKKYYPDIYKQIKKQVKQGRWEPIGVFWVESDTNVPSGESLVRQMLYGHEYYMKEFGGYTPIAWLPDVFGYSPALPQILKKAGIEYFFTAKVFWQSENQFPYRVFWWEGIDGSRVLAHTPLTGLMYNNDPSPKLYRYTWEQFTQKDQYDGVLIPYGFGDGGGGPSEEQIEQCRFLQKMPAVPKSRFSTVYEYYKHLEKNAKDLPVWRGEIYVESHRGTLTSQAWLKQANRQAEQLYRQAEIFSSFCQIIGHAPDIKLLKEGWKLILINQFHDVLPGSSIAEVYKDARKHHKKVRQWGEDVLEKSLAMLMKTSGLVRAKKGLCVFNPTSWLRSDLVEVDGSECGDTTGLKTADGLSIPVQSIKSTDGKRKLLFEAESVPPLGLRYFLLSDEKAVLLEQEITVTKSRIENRFFRIDLTPEGLIHQITDKASKRSFIEKGRFGNLLQLFCDGPVSEEAWNIDPAYEEIVHDIVDVRDIRVLESGPLRGRLQIRRSFGKSNLMQEIIIYRNKPVTDFRTWVDWQERNRMLKVVFPTTLRCQYATCEVAYGAYQRPTYRNNPWEKQMFEVAMHRFVDISEGNCGLSILNDCKYACDVLGGRIRLTLLRGPNYPDPEADRGEHVFTYSVCLHEGDWRSGRVVQHASELNNPLLCRRTGGMGGLVPDTDQRCFLAVKPDNIIIEVLKKAENKDAIILRAYESSGNWSQAAFELDFAADCVKECDLLERPGKKIRLNKGKFKAEFQPFEIRSFIISM